MESILIKLAGDAPIAVAVIFVVVYMMRSLNARAEAYDKSIRDISASCHDVQFKAIEAMNLNSRALGKLTEAIRHSKEIE